MKRQGISRRKEGDWQFTIQVDGKRKNRRGFASQAAAYAALLTTERELKEQAKLAHGRPETLGEIITIYIEEHAAQQCEPKTLEGYRQKFKYLSPALRDTRLEDLTTLMLEREYTRLLKSGGEGRWVKGPKPLSAKSVHHVANLVSMALKNGIRLNFLRQNVASACKLPALTKAEGRALDARELSFFFAAASQQGFYLEPFLRVTLSSGGRRGELLALTWSDINLATGELSITKSLGQVGEGLQLKGTKTRQNRRVMLDEETLQVLEAHRVKQRAIAAAFGADYRHDLNLVFCGASGDFLRPGTVSSAACKASRKAGVKASLHTLRHTCGSLLVEHGATIVDVSQRLGHSSPATTNKVYLHASRTGETTLSGKMGDVIRKVNKVGETEAGRVQ